jgi:uncharacterized protein YjiS (DUF1127 family)
MKLAFELRPGRSLRLPSHRPLLLRVQQGRVWLTRRNDRDDHFIVAGRGVALAGSDRDTVVEVQGGDAAALQLQLGPVAGPLRRLWHWLRRPWADDGRASLLELDEHVLRDIGASPDVFDNLRRHQALCELRATQARLMQAR